MTVAKHINPSRLICRRFGFMRAVLMMAALMIFITSGCKPVDRAEAAHDQPTSRNVVSVMSDSVSYRHDREIKYTLYDLSRQPAQAVGGSIVVPLATGGSKGCCIALPTTWESGMKVRVVWGEADQKIYPEEYVRELEIPRYDKAADLYVVFYPEHEVEVVVSSAEPGHPDWQGKVKQTPWEACVQAHGRKPCKAVLPKQFDTASAQGFCIYLQEEWSGDKDKQGHCESEMIACMRDYEDEGFCKGILWGEPCISANKDFSPYCIARAKRLNKGIVK